MTKFSYRDGIALLQLIVFAPCMLLALFLWIKHGFKAKPRCWRYVFILSAMRVCGSICQLIYINNKREGLIVAIIVCDLLGISPLTLACIGQIERVLVEAQP